MLDTVTWSQPMAAVLAGPGPRALACCFNLKFDRSSGQSRSLPQQTLAELDAAGCHNEIEI